MVPRLSIDILEMNGKAGVREEIIELDAGSPIAQPGDSVQGTDGRIWNVHARRFVYGKDGWARVELTCSRLYPEPSDEPDSDPG